MKKLMMISGLLILSYFPFAQARDGTAELKLAGVGERAASIYLPYSTEVVMKALESYVSSNIEKNGKDSSKFLLSKNTLLVKNNPGADMHFSIGPRGGNYPEQTVIYLKLNSELSNSYDPANKQVLFSMAEAKEYLDNLAIAIQPFAKDLQIKLQTKNLADASAKKVELIETGDKLAQNGKQMEKRLLNVKGRRKVDRLSRQITENRHQLDRNIVEQRNQDDEIERQKASLALLMSISK